MISAILQVTLLNRHIKRGRYKVTIRSTNYVKKILSALAEVGLLKIAVPAVLTCELRPDVLVCLTFSKGKPLLQGITIVSSGGHKSYWSYQLLFNEAMRGTFYVISTSEGIYTTLSPRFQSNKIGGVCLFRLKFATSDK